MNKIKNCKEKYTYTANVPKNISKIKLTPDYGYDYALYKPENRNPVINEKIEKNWAGVI
jgi:hypothetical protein